MKAVWTSNLTGDDKKKFEDLLKNNISQAIKDRLEVILHNAIEVMDIETESLRQYDKPNWSAYQAHLNGYRQALTMVLDLFDMETKPNGKR